MEGELLALRLIHVLGGIFWVGSALFNALFLFPAFAQAGPAAGQVMAELARRRAFIFMPVIALLTILSGIRLMGITSGFSSDYLSTPSGRTFAIAALAAILAFVFGILVNRPVGVRVAQISASLANAAPDERQRLSAELDKFRGRLSMATTVVVILLLVAATGMAIGRYVS
ncbi:MAG TPA: hypothetical protein VJ803_05520 [Gemmatimonadaceae bacterium]|nr:hypothetical protein [Gemmatimonadaceae bacterium]